MDPDTLKEHIDTIGQFVRQYHNLNHPDYCYANCYHEPCSTQKKLEEEMDNERV